MVSRSPECETSCLLYQECKTTNSKDAAIVESQELSEMFEGAHIDHVTNRDISEKIKDFDERLWLLEYGSNRNDIDERRAKLEELLKEATHGLEMLENLENEFVSERRLQNTLDAATAKERLGIGKELTDAVDAEGCDGPTMERTTEGEIVYVACNAPVSPLVMELAKKAFMGSNDEDA